MKKIIAMLLALVMVLGLAACASKTEPAQPEEPAATETTPAAEETTEEPAETTEEPATTEATGSVYYLNFKPEADEAWQKIAVRKKKLVANRKSATGRRLSAAITRE